MKTKKLITVILTSEMTLSLEFKLEDFWIGVFWNRSRASAWAENLSIWLCLIPCFPIHLSIWLPDPKEQGEQAANRIDMGVRKERE